MVLKIQGITGKELCSTLPGCTIPVTEPIGLRKHQIVVQWLLHEVLLKLPLTLNIVYDGLEALLAQWTLGFDLEIRFSESYRLKGRKYVRNLLYSTPGGS